jgi:hypothetical protein
LYVVQVGHRKQPFAIHNHIVNKIPLLSERFLQLADSIEAKTGSMELVDANTSAFAVAIDFAYTDGFDGEAFEKRYAAVPDMEESTEKDDDSECEIVAPSSMRTARSTRTASPDDCKHEEKSDDEDEETEGKEDDVRPAYDILLVKVYDLAEALQYEALANAVIDAYCKFVAENPPSSSSLFFLQRKGLEQSNLMDLMLRSIAWRVKTDGYEAWEDEDFMTEFAQASPANSAMVMKAMADHHDQENPFGDQAQICDYHTHVTTERCIRKRQIISKVAKAAKVKRQKRY